MSYSSVFVPNNNYGYNYGNPYTSSVIFPNNDLYLSEGSTDVYTDGNNIYYVENPNPNQQIINLDPNTYYSPFIENIDDLFNTNASPYLGSTINNIPRIRRELIKYYKKKLLKKWLYDDDLIDI